MDFIIILVIFYLRFTSVEISTSTYPIYPPYAPTTDAPTTTDPPYTTTTDATIPPSTITMFPTSTTAQDTTTDNHPTTTPYPISTTSNPTVTTTDPGETTIPYTSPTTTMAATTTDASTTTTDAPTTTTDAPTTATDAPTTTPSDPCSSSGSYITPSTGYDYIYSPGYSSGSYPSNQYCTWHISAPADYSVEAVFNSTAFGLESNTYCTYDYVAIYDGNSTSSLINKFCGFDRPTTTFRSSNTDMLIVFVSDYATQFQGFALAFKAVTNTYPGCKSSYTEYAAQYNAAAANVSTPTFGSSEYSINTDIYWLFTNSDTTSYLMVLEITSIDIEKASGCIYDKLVLYNGPCTKDAIYDYACGTRLISWYLDGPEYLLQFHSDSSMNGDGFQLQYYLVAAGVTPPPTNTTTINGPELAVVVDAIKSMLTNYSFEDLPTKNLSQAINVKIDFYLVGVNDIDEVAQKMTSTGQFIVTWRDSQLTWEPSKRQQMVKVLLPQNDLWKPDIALMNGFTKIEAMGADFMFIVVDYNGSCTWNPYQIMESVCRVDMTYYPYDRQTCTLKFGTWSSDDSEVKTELGSLGLQFHTNFQENSEWRLIGTETKQEDKNNHKTVDFLLTLERNPRFVTYYMTIPVVMLAYMNVFTFVIPSGSGEKSGYCITIFLSFVVLLIINSGSIPDNSDSISLYASYILTMTLMSGVTLIICVLEIRSITLSKRRYPIPNCLKSIIKSIMLLRAKTICLDKRKSKVDEENHSKGKQSHNKKENKKVKDRDTKGRGKQTEKLEQKALGEFEKHSKGKSVQNFQSTSSGNESGKSASSTRSVISFKSENSNTRFKMPQRLIKDNDSKDNQLAMKEPVLNSNPVSQNDGKFVANSKAEEETSQEVMTTGVSMENDENEPSEKTFEEENKNNHSNEQEPKEENKQQMEENLTGETKTSSLSNHTVDKKRATRVDFRINQPSTIPVTRKTLQSYSAMDKSILSVNRLLPRGHRPAKNSIAATYTTASERKQFSQKHVKHVSIKNQHPFVVSSKRPFDRLVNGKESSPLKVHVKEHKKPVQEAESASEQGNNQSESEASWKELDSCIDFLFFVCFMITTTLFSLGLFLAMVTAY